jgi:hypothetical protein
MSGGSKKRTEFEIRSHSPFVCVVRRGSYFRFKGEKQ